MSEPPEERVVAYLQELREDPPAPAGSMTPQIVRTARWQQAVRRPAGAVGVLAAAFGDGLAIAIGLRRHRR